MENTENNVVENTVEESQVEAVETKEEVSTEGTLLSGEVGEEEVSEKTFKDSLPDELKNDPFVSKFDNIEDLIKSAAHANKLIGKKVEDFSKEDIEAFANITGKPESLDSYELAEGLDEVSNKEFKEVFFEAGLNKEQAKALTAKFVEAQQNAIKENEEALNLKMVDAKEALKKEFGSSYDQHIHLATNTIKNVGGDELLTMINNSGLGLEPSVIKAFAKLGKDLGEHNIVKSGGGSKGFGLTPQEASEQLADLLSDKDFYKRYSNPTAPGHTEAFEKISRLYKIKSGQ